MTAEDVQRNETALPLAWEAEADRQPSDAYGRGRADALRDAAAALRLRRRACVCDGFDALTCDVAGADCSLREEA